MKPFRLLFLIFLSAASCTEDFTDDVDKDKGIRIPLTLSCEPLEEEAESRSSHPDKALTAIGNVNYYLFHNKKLISQAYFDDVQNFYVTLPSIKEEYNLYLLANTGEIHINNSLEEKEMASAVHVDYGSKENYFSSMTTQGFPMAAIIENFSFASSTSHTLKRLVHTLYLKIDKSELESTILEFTGVAIRQAPRDVFPFAAESKALNVIDGDAVSLNSDDINKLNTGETIRLHLLENMRGPLIPGNTSWKAKVPANIPSATERALASYIELTARAETVTATYENVRYRTYLGYGPSDFNVKRSTSFIITNSFTNDMIKDENWRIESDTPNVTGQLAFVDTRYTKETSAKPNDTGDNDYRPFKEVDAFYTMKGFTNVYYIYRSDPRIEYYISMEPTNSTSSDYKSYVTYKTSRIDDHFTAIMINTTYPIATGGQYLLRNPAFDEGKSVTFKITSADGNIEDKMICKILTEPLGMRFEYNGVTASDPVNDNGTLNMYFTNPLGLGVRVEISGKIKGYLTHKPNGSMLGSKELHPEVLVRTGNKYSESSYGSTSGTIRTVIPVTGEPSRIDCYNDLTSNAGKITELDGFHELFKNIWDKTGWDATTWLNDSKGYYKHARPTELTLNFKLKFVSPNIKRLLPHNFSGNTFQLPVYFQNRELTISEVEGHGAYYGAGTDLDFIWHQFDKESSSDYVTYKFLKSTKSPDKTYYYGENQLPVGMTINETSTWETDGIGIPCAEVVSESPFSNLGFTSYK